MKNKLFIGLNKADFEDDGKMIILIAKNEEKAFELGNTSAGLPFDKTILIGESDLEEQILLRYNMCGGCMKDEIKFGELLSPYIKTLVKKNNTIENNNLWAK